MFPTRSDTKKNPPVQRHKMARGLKLRIQKVEGLYYLSRESKGADQLHGYGAADLRLCFRICNNQVFSLPGSHNLWCFDFISSHQYHFSFFLGIEMFAIGVGLRDNTELFGIASRKENVVSLANFDSLRGSLKQLTKQICRKSYDQAQSGKHARV